MNPLSLPGCRSELDLPHIPVSAHAIQQFRTRIFPAADIAEARRILRGLAVSVRDQRDGRRTIFKATLEGACVVLVIRDGYIVTCWDDRHPPRSILPVNKDRLLKGD